MAIGEEESSDEITAPEEQKTTREIPEAEMHTFATGLSANTVDVDTCSHMTYVFLFACLSQMIHNTHVLRFAVSLALPSSLSAYGAAGVLLASSDPIAGAVQ